MITRTNASVKYLKAIVDAAFLSSEVDKDGDIFVDARCRVWIFCLPDESRLQLYAQYKMKPESAELDRLRAVNSINRDYIMVKADFRDNGILPLRYDICLEHGVSEAAFCRTIDRFASVVYDAVHDCAGSLLA